MKNHRRRLEIMILCGYLGAAFDLTKSVKHGNMAMAGPFRFLPDLDALHQHVAPSAVERRDDLVKAGRMLNDFAPLGWRMWEDMQKFWYVCELTKRLVRNGWKMPQDPTCSEFIISLMSTEFGSLQIPPNAMCFFDKLKGTSIRTGLFT